MTQLTGKVALVTGGSRGIGAAVAKRLAHDGAEVALTYAGSEDKAQAVVADIEQAGGRAMAIQADSRDDRAIEAAVERVVSSYGGLDILVNNAGVFLIGDIAELERDDLDRTLAINLRAPFVAIQVAARHMRDEGRIVSIGSNLGPRVPWPGSVSTR